MINFVVVELKVWKGHAWSLSSRVTIRSASLDSGAVTEKTTAVITLMKILVFVVRNKWTKLG